MVNKVRTFIPILALILILSITILEIVGCSSSIPPTTTTSTPVIIQVPIETPELGLKYPNRYIDWQAEVVCYYLSDAAISCLPLTDTRIIIR